MFLLLSLPADLLSSPDICLELEIAIKLLAPNIKWKFITDAEGDGPANNSIHWLFQAVAPDFANRML